MRDIRSGIYRAAFLSDAEVEMVINHVAFGEIVVVGPDSNGNFREIT